MNYQPGQYSNAFMDYLSNAELTGFDWYLTVQDRGVAGALELVEEHIKENNE